MQEAFPSCESCQGCSNPFVRIPEGAPRKRGGSGLTYVNVKAVQGGWMTLLEDDVAIGQLVRATHCSSSSSGRGRCFPSVLCCPSSHESVAGITKSLTATTNDSRDETRRMNSYAKQTMMASSPAAAAPSLLTQVGMAGSAAVITVTFIHPIDVVKVCHPTDEAERNDSETVMQHCLMSP
jgi:hypothetical protein